MKLHQGVALKRSFFISGCGIIGVTYHGLCSTERHQKVVFSYFDKLPSFSLKAFRKGEIARLVGYSLSVLFPFSLLSRRGW